MAGPVVQSYLTKNVKAPINEPKVGRESTFSSPLNQKRYSYRVTTMLLSLPERTRVSLGNKKPQLGFGETFLYRFLDSLITPPPSILDISLARVYYYSHRPFPLKLTLLPWETFLCIFHVNSENILNVSQISICSTTGLLAICVHCLSGKMVLIFFSVT